MAAPMPPVAVCSLIAVLILQLVCIWSLTVTVVVASSSQQTEADTTDNIVFESGNHQSLKFGHAKPRRYLLYDVNHGEGFNLRRDVYMRMANLARRLLEEGDWVLVLPPWGGLYHWKTRSLTQIRIPWATFFDVESLNRFVPVMEFEDFVKETGEAVIDQILYLQAYKEGWTDGKWEERIDERDCIDPTAYHLDEEGVYRGWFWGYSDAKARAFKCLSVQGMAQILVPMLTANITVRSVFVDRGETVLHDVFGDVNYWAARRSMRFAKHLRHIGDEYRESKLGSTDRKDGTEVMADWRDMKRKPGSAVGGPYLAAHLRRSDYARNDRKDVPSLLSASRQIISALQKQNLDAVFIATDAPKHEFDELRKYLQGYKVYHYVPPRQVLDNFKDGGVAIIDQWICAHARYFIGTGVSTFSFRIHEERQILGIDTAMTYNRFCGDGESQDCDQPSVWEIVYD